MNRILLFMGLWIWGNVVSAQVGSVNGNDWALAYAESQTDQEREELRKEAGRRSHYFRYLQIMEMKEEEERGRSQVNLVTLEPASGLDIAFTVQQPVSLQKLQEEPVTRRGHAIAISGIIDRVEDESGTIYLRQAIVRHKDQLAPMLKGREMLYEIDDRNIFYSFSGGRETVQLSYRDRDLLRYRDRILDAKGDQAWADFLQKKIAERQAARNNKGPQDAESHK